MDRFLWMGQNGHPALGGYISASWVLLTFICQDNRGVAASIGTTQRDVNTKETKGTQQCLPCREGPPMK